MLLKIKHQGFPRAQLYQLSNARGLCVQLCGIGASIHAVQMKDRDGNFQNIALSLPNEHARRTDASYSGATIGPVAGRIAQGRLLVGEQEYRLVKNEGEHTLHGGDCNAARMDWDIFKTEENALTFRCVLPDGLEGFPGERELYVTYTLYADNRLLIRYTASTTKPTFLNLTNHTYWNLGGDFTKDASGHLLQIGAQQVSLNDNTHIPIASSPVQDSVFDYRTLQMIRARMRAGKYQEQLEFANGYNHAFLLNPDADFSARLLHPGSGRWMELCTDYPALVFYAGGYLPVPNAALALEAQYCPGTYKPLLTPGNVYQHYISYRFGTMSEEQETCDFSACEGNAFGL